MAGKNDIGEVSEKYKERFKGHLEDDLDTPRALATVWDLVKDGNVSNADKKATLLDFDRVLGLDFENAAEKTQEEIPEEFLKIVKEREEARKNKDFKKSDELREKINSLGYEVKDTGEGQKISAKETL